MFGGTKIHARAGRRSSRARGLRMEQLEDRMLLSIGGLGNESIHGVELASAADMISLRYDLPELHMEATSDTPVGPVLYEGVMPGASESLLDDRAALPVVPVEIAVPYGCTVDSVEVIAEGGVTLPGSYALVGGGCQGSLYEVVGTQWRRGVQVLWVNLNPAQYSPETGTVSYYSSLTLNVGLGDAGADAETDGPAVAYRPDTILPLENDVANPSALATYVQESGEPTEPEADASGLCDPADSYQYVVITSSEIAGASEDYTVHDLVEYKQDHGMTATVVTLEDIYANYPGEDQQEQIRNFIRDAYSNWETDYILLGGDMDVLPCRFLYVPVDPHLGGIKEQSIPSDFYYQCLDGNFNGDGDGYWGEAEDSVDTSAEVYIGRVPADDSSEMANWVYKNIVYEESASDPYRFSALLAAEYLGFDGPMEWGSALMEQLRLGGTYDGYTTAGFNSNPDFNTTTLYDSSSYTWTVSQMMAAMNSDDYGIYNAADRANATHSMKLSNANVDTLTNDNPFFVYTQGSNSGKFYGDTIAEHFTTSTRSGAAAAVLNGRVGWGKDGSTNGESQRVNRQFWDALFGEGIEELGAMNADSHHDWVGSIGNIKIRWVIYETNLFGDPAAKMVELDMTVVDSTPGEGESVTTPITDFEVTFSQDYLASSVTAGDLVVNGVAADSYTLTSSNSVTFHYNTSPITSEGPQTMSMASGAIRRQHDNNAVIAWNTSFWYDSHIMAVESTDPVYASTVTTPHDYIEVNFDEAVLADSIGTDDLILSQGTVVSATLVDADTVRYTLDGLSMEGPCYVDLPRGAVTDAWGNPVAAYSGGFGVEFGTVPFPTPLEAEAPLGGLIYTGSASGGINFTGDVDQFTIELEAGQTLAALVDPGSAWRPSVELLGPDGTNRGATTSTSAGTDAVLHTIAIDTSGTYTISLASADTTRGSYTLEVMLGAEFEMESHDGTTNNNPATAQDLSACFTSLGNGMAQRGAVAGTLESSGDYYRFDLEAGESVTVAFAASDGLLVLCDSSGEPIVMGEATMNARAMIRDYVAPAAGTYYVGVGAGTGDYRLAIVKNADFDVESNDSFDTAQPLGDAEGVLGYLDLPSDPVTLRVVDAGEWCSNGLQSAYNDHDISCGRPDYMTAIYRNYFVFDLSSVTGIIESANLNVWSQNYNGDATETYCMYEVSTDVATLVTPASGRTDIFDDLGSGDVLATRVFSSADIGTMVNVVLNGTGLDHLNMGRGDLIALGGALTSIDSSDDYIFCAAACWDNRQWLTLTFAPADDWYSIEAEAGELITLTTSTPGVSADVAPQIELYDAAGTLVASGTIGPDGRNQTIEYTATAADTYRIKVVNATDAEGAYYLSRLPAPDPIPGDANRDGTVDQADAAVMSAHWGMSGMSWDEGDFNDDGHVNLADASILAANWGATVAVNHTPLAQADSYSVDENTSLTVDSQEGVLGNDSDVDEGDTLTAVLVSSTAHGSLSLDSSGAFVYTPNAGYVGQDSFLYRAFDGQCYSSVVTVDIEVVDVNQPPTAVDDEYDVTAGSSLVLYKYEGVLVNDSDPDGPDALTASLLSDVSHGSLTLYSTGALSYTPSPGFTGTDSFTYRAFDGESYSDPATVVFNVASAEALPEGADEPLIGPVVAPLGIRARRLIDSLARPVEGDPLLDDIAKAAVAAISAGQVSPADQATSQTSLGQVDAAALAWSHSIARRSRSPRDANQESLLGPVVDQLLATDNV